MLHGSFYWYGIQQLFVVISRPSDTCSQLHVNAHIALVFTIATYALNWFGRLYPPLSCFLNFGCLLLYIIGVAGVAAFGFALHLMTECSSGVACTTFKIAFITSHGAGYLAP